MNKTQILASSVLWATAIVSAAAWHAPATLTLVVLPSLAAAAWLVALRKGAAPSCRK